MVTRVPHANWRTLTLAELGRIVTGKTPPTKIGCNFGGDIPFVTPTDMDGRRTISTTARYLTKSGAYAVKGCRIPAGAVMVSCIGSDLGKAAIAGKDSITNQQINTIVVGGEFDANFIYYNLSTRQNELKRRGAGGSAVPILNKGHFSQLTINLPPLSEQRVIASILGSLDDKIELNRRMNETLEGIARALFKSWFVDFDPVRAKMDGRQPADMAPEIADLFPSEFEHVSGELIPNGWVNLTVKDFADGIYDGPHATPPKATNGPVFLGIRNLTGTKIDLSDIRCIGENDWPRWTKRVQPRCGDIVFTYEATLGYFALIPPNLRCCLGRRLALVRPRAEMRIRHFVFHSFTSDRFLIFLNSHAIHGATVNRVPLSEFPNYPVLWPGLPLAFHFDSIAEPMWSHIHRNDAESGTLASLRDTLLPKLVSGELRVPEAEKMLESVL